MSETINPPVRDTRRGFTRYAKSDSVERGFQPCVTMATSNRAIKCFEMTDPWPFKERPGVRSRGRSRWNILPGTRAAGAFHAERESQSKLGYRSRSRSQPLKILPVSHPYQGGRSGVGAPEICLKLNQSRQDILFTPEAPAEANTFSDFRVGI